MHSKSLFDPAYHDWEWIFLLSTHIPFSLAKAEKEVLGIRIERTVVWTRYIQRIIPFTFPTCFSSCCYSNRITLHAKISLHNLISQYNKQNFSKCWRDLFAIWNMFIVQNHCTEIKSITYILCHLYLYINVIFRLVMQENHSPNEVKNYWKAPRVLQILGSRQVKFLAV